MLLLLPQMFPSSNAAAHHHQTKLSCWVMSTCCSSLDDLRLPWKEPQAGLWNMPGPLTSHGWKEYGEGAASGLQCGECLRRAETHSGAPSCPILSSLHRPAPALSPDTQQGLGVRLDVLEVLPKEDSTFLQTAPAPFSSAFGTQQLLGGCCLSPY